jgi:succinate dehydrogenase/fumarate reductase-like Fe-S protein
MSLIATLLIARAAPGQAERGDRFEVPFEPGESVLDGLRRIRASHDPTLAFRFSCINANACKECMLLLDGKTVYACTARLEPREMRLEPLRNKELIRDLAVEIAPPDERITFLERNQRPSR